MTAIAIVGAGPRGTGVLERIAANADLLGDARCTIHVIDPQPPGGGRVWRADQSALLLMNSYADEVTMFTDASVRCAGPPVPGPTLAEWASTARLSDPGLAAEAAALTGDSFATRRLGGQYLGWCFDRAARALPERMPVHVHRATAVRLRDGGRQVITLSNGERIAADLVVLAQGNVGGRGDAAQLAHQRFARRTHGVYLPPACAGDDDLDRLPAGEPVLVSGIGLAFVDLMVLLTEGRGGRFVRDRHGKLTYRPSGREPVLHVGSRRGVPYLPKPARRLYGERSTGARFFTAEYVLRTLAGAERPQAALLTCALRELAWAHYRELFTAHGERTTVDWPGFAERFAAIPITDPRIERLVECGVPDPADRVDFSFLRSPLTGLRFADQSALDRWMVDRIDTTVRRATDPRHSAHAAVSHGLRTVADQVESLLNTGAHQAGLARFVGRLAGLTAFTGSGPPPHRLAQLAALAESGVVRFLGANLRIGHAGEAFIATTDSLAAPVAAHHLIEARLPDPDIRSGADPLLAGLGAWRDRLPVAQSTFQVLDERGVPHPKRLAMGAFASGGALGSFARPGRDAAFFRQNDAAARWLLDQLMRLDPRNARHVPRR